MEKQRGKQLGLVIRRLRDRCEMSQDRLAELADSTQKTISMIEAGIVDAHWGTIGDLLDVLLPADLMVRSHLLAEAFDCAALRGTDPKSVVPGPGVAIVDIDSLEQSEAFQASKEKTKYELDHGQYAKAFPLALTTLRIARTPLEQANAYHLYGNVESNFGHLHMAMISYQAAMVLFNPSEDPELWAKLRVNLVKVEAELGFWWTAIPHATEIERTATSLQIRGFAALALGKALVKQGLQKDAEEAFARSAGTFAKMGSVGDEAYARMWGARAHAKLGTPKAEKEGLATLHEIAEEIDEPDVAGWTAAFIYELTGDRSAREKAAKIGRKEGIVAIEKFLEEVKTQRMRDLGRKIAVFAGVLLGSQALATIVAIAHAIARTAN